MEKKHTSRYEELTKLISIIEYDLPNLKSKELKETRVKQLNEYKNELKSLKVLVC